jgi:hypothetical protein
MASCFGTGFFLRRDREMEREVSTDESEWEFVLRDG